MASAHALGFSRHPIFINCNFLEHMTMQYIDSQGKEWDINLCVVFIKLL